MRKTTIVSVIAIFLCFMTGYLAYEIAHMTQTWVMERFSDCKHSRNAKCTETPDKPLVESDRR